MNITDYPNRTEECIECEGSAHFVEVDHGDFVQEGYECDDCGATFGT